MAEHTPGRLVATQKGCNVGDWWEACMEDGHSVFLVMEGHGLPGDSPAEEEANARRLVALWNACQGITTEQLEGCDDYGQRYNDHRHRLEMLSDFARDASFEHPDPVSVEFPDDDDKAEGRTAGQLPG